jgi:FtsP/CotA-like multicopper oxidase with cupredoxin domain
MKALLPAILATALMFCPVYAQEHEREGHMHGEEQAPASDEEYIRVMSPAGYDVVIGRKNPLPELTPKIVKEGGKTIKVFRLTVKDVKFEISPGKTVEGWGFNGQVPGPIIRVKEGDRLRVIMTNETDDKHTFHVHGQKKSVIMDGVPYVGQKPVEKGESYIYEFTAEMPGTSFYHCHVDSAHHVDMGMYGPFIVEPKKVKYPFDREYVMVLDEWPTAHIHIHEEAMPMDEHKEHGVVTEHPGEPVHEHQMEEKPAKRDWYPETYNEYMPVYDTFVINGKAFPYTEPIEVKKGERVKIRFINAGYEPHYMHVHAHKFLVTHRDGAPVKNLLLDANNPGVWPFHCHRLNHIANDNIYPGGMLFIMRYID